MRYQSIRAERTWEVSGQFRRPLRPNLTLSQFTLAGLAGQLLAPFLFLLTGALLCVPAKAVQEIINQVLEKLEEYQVPMPDYALKSSGAVTLYKQTGSKALPVHLDKTGICMRPVVGEKGQEVKGHLVP